MIAINTSIENRYCFTSAIMPPHQKKLENWKKIVFQTLRQTTGNPGLMTREWRKTGSETLLPGGTFHSRVQEGEPPERRSWMSHWIEETEVRFRGNKRGWSLWGRISNSWDVGKEKAPEVHTEVPWVNGWLLNHLCVKKTLWDLARHLGAGS